MWKQEIELTKEKMQGCTSSCEDDAKKLGVAVKHYPWCNLYNPNNPMPCPHCNGTGLLK